MMMEDSGARYLAYLAFWSNEMVAVFFAKCYIGPLNTLGRIRCAMALLITDSNNVKRKRIALLQRICVWIARTRWGTRNKLQAAADGQRFPFFVLPTRRPSQ